MAPRPTAIVAGVALLAALGACIAGLALEKWYVTKVSGVSSHSGLWKQCPLEKCEDLKFENSQPTITVVRNGVQIPAVVCLREGNDLKARINAVRALVIIGGAFALFGVATVPVAIPIVATVRCVLCVMSPACIAAGFSVYLWTMRYWVWCDTDQCSHIALTTGNTACEQTYGVGLYLQFAAAGAGVFAFFVALVDQRAATAAAAAAGAAAAEPAGAGETRAVATAPSPTAAERRAEAERQKKAAKDEKEARDKKDKEEKDKKKAQQKSGSKPQAEEASEDRSVPPTAAAATAEPAAEAAAEADAPVLPDGNWVLQPESGLYWSEDAHMFYHVETKQFYNPNTGQWFNTETNTWYTPEE